MTIDEIANTCYQIADELSLGNSYYNWELRTATIRAALHIFNISAQMTLEGELTKVDFISCVYAYCNTVYQETEQDDKEKLYFLTRALPIEDDKDFTLSAREAEFIGQRWMQLEYRDGCEDTNWTPATIRNVDFFFYGYCLPGVYQNVTDLIAWHDRQFPPKDKVKKRDITKPRELRKSQQREWHKDI